MIVFAVPLCALVRSAAASNLSSHTLLIPFVCAYLIRIHWNGFPRSYVAAPGWVVALAVAGIASLAVALKFSRASISQNDYLTLMASAFVCFVWVGAFLFLGRAWLRAAAFPVAFLIFFVPMPDALADYLENASKVASAEVANFLFTLSGTPVLRDGAVFQLPGISIEVAKECSGIRSSFVLFITSLLASYLFLATPWRRVALVALVIPLGLLRNGIRILTISLLCVHIGPHMIHSVIHRRGGPVFFGASLLPLFFFLWWLRRGEERRLPDNDRRQRSAPAGHSPREASENVF